MEMGKEERDILIAFGRKLRKLRLGSRLTQQRLAELAELSLTYIQALEAGSKNPSFLVLCRLRAALGISLFEFECYEDIGDER